MQGGKIESKKINYEIRFPEVNLIDENGNPKGTVETKNAIDQAKLLDLDLVLVAEKASPPVAKIMDYGKFKYEQEKAIKKQKAQQKNVDTKEVRVTPNISKHDLEIRIERAKDFLSQGNKVKITLRIFGRNLQYAQDKQVIVEDFVKAVSEVGEIEERIKKEGNQFLAIIRPKR